MRSLSARLAKLEQAIARGQMTTSYRLPIALVETSDGGRTYRDEAGRMLHAADLPVVGQTCRLLVIAELTLD